MNDLHAVRVDITPLLHPCQPKIKFTFTRGYVYLLTLYLYLLSRILFHVEQFYRDVFHAQLSAHIYVLARLYLLKPQKTCFSARLSDEVCAFFVAIFFG